MLQTTGATDVGDLIESLEGKDFATQTTLNDLLTNFNAEDFASETTLSSIDGKVATETTLSSLEGKDFSTETTLAELKDRLGTAGTDEVGVLIESLENKVATQAELEAVKSELETIKANQTNGDQKMQQTGRNVELVNTSATWAENATAGTEQEIEIAIPDDLQRDNVYLFLVHNDSGVTTISGNLKIKWEDESLNNRETPTIDFGTIDENTGISELLQGSLLADGAKIVLENDTELGEGEGFAVYVQVREV